MLTLTNLSNGQHNKALWRQKSCSPLQNGSKPEQMVLPQPAGASQTLQKNDRGKSSLIIPYSNWSWEVNGLSAEEMVGWLRIVFLYNKHPKSSHLGWCSGSCSKVPTSSMENDLFDLINWKNTGHETKTSHFFYKQIIHMPPECSCFFHTCSTDCDFVPPISVLVI